jgi:hypothetical protein
MFDRFYAAQCLQAVDDPILDRTGDGGLLQMDIKEKFTFFFESLEGGKSSLQIRREEMAALASQPNLLKTTQTCFFCLGNSREHELVCGHSVCDTCVPRFGKQPFGMPYHLELSACLLCLAKVQFVTREELATIDPCVLSIDGGGIKGRVALELLHALQEILGRQIPIQAYFDLFVGTSSGLCTQLPKIEISC